MKEFKVAQLRSGTPELYNEVMINKAVILKHQHRPTMVLVLKDHYDHLRERASKHEG